MKHGFAHNGAAAPGDPSTVLLVLGMKDNRCREDVTAALERVPGVMEVQVSLYRGLAVVRHRADCAVEDMIVAVVRAGYGASMTLLRPPSGLPKPDGNRPEQDG